MKKRVFIELSDEISELTITSAFLGASKNFFIVEEHFYNLNKIPLNQYFNYLSQLAFCIELGLKNIIKITNKVWKSHDLEILFFAADDETSHNLSKKFFGSYNNNFKQQFLGLLKNCKLLFEESRYCCGNSLRYFFNDQYLLENDILDFKEIIQKNDAIVMLKLFLEELGEYHNFIHNYSIKNAKTENDPSAYIYNITKIKFDAQQNISVEEK